MHFYYELTARGTIDIVANSTDEAEGQINATPIDQLLAESGNFSLDIEFLDSTEKID